MSTATIPPATTRPAPPGPAAADPAAVRTLLVGHGVTLLPPLAALIALQVWWEGIADGGWAPAAAAVTGWALGVVGWLRRRGWRPDAVRTVVGAPAAVLAGPAALGWLSPDGVVLWGPVSAVLVVALVMATSTPTPADSPRHA